MRKMIYILLAGTVVGLVGCGQGQNRVATQNQKNALKTQRISNGTSLAEQKQLHPTRLAAADDDSGTLLTYPADSNNQSDGNQGQTQMNNNQTQQQPSNQQMMQPGQMPQQPMQPGQVPQQPMQPGQTPQQQPAQPGQVPPPMVPAQQPSATKSTVPNQRLRPGQTVPNPPTPPNQGMMGNTTTQPPQQTGQ